ncbi:MAG: hypothetical protein AAF423_08675 [Pseudomonadota bacterium]
MKVIQFAALFLLLSTTGVYSASVPWNDFERQQAALKFLGSKSSSFDCGRKCNHRIFGVRTVNFDDHSKKLIAVSSSDPENNCHACAPQLSYLFYRVDQSGWELVASHVAFHYFGSWGDYPEELMSFDKISDREALVILRFGYTGQGYTEESITALSPSGSALKQVLSTCSGSDNEGAIYDPATQPLISWSAEVNIASSYEPAGGQRLVFDIEDRAKGSRSNAEFNFDGKQYRYASGDERMKNCEY